MTPFENYLKNRPNHLEQLIKWSLETMTQDRFEFVTYHKKKRILDAVKERDGRLYEKLLTCYSTKRKTYNYGKKACRNIYCPSCRNWQAYIFQTNVRAKLKQEQIKKVITTKDDVLFSEETTFLDLLTENEPSNENYLNITGFIGLVEPTLEATQEAIDKDTNTWNKIRHNIKRLSYRPLWVEVAYEFEIINWAYLRLAPESDFKKKQVEQMREAVGYTKNEAILVHYHGITNLTKEELGLAFKDYYHIGGKPLIKNDQTTGLYIQSLHKDKPFFTNVQKLTSYPFKQALRFKHSWIGSDHISGEPFTPEELYILINIYDKIKEKKLFRSCSNGLKPWSDLELTINKVIEEAVDNKNIRSNKLIIECLPHLSKIKQAVETMKNTDERLAKCSKAMKAMASFYVKQGPYGLSNKEVYWFKRGYGALYSVIRNLDHHYVRSVTVTRTIDQLDKARMKKPSKLINTIKSVKWV